MKKLLFLLISTIIIACGDNPTQISESKEPVEPNSSNIIVNPEFMVLKPISDTMLFVFKGVDFSKHEVDKICFDNNTLLPYQVTKELYVARLTHRNTGEFNVNIYFKSGLITLDKKVRIFPEGYVVPDVQNITFSPDTMLITLENQFSRLVFKGIDFKKFQFDSVLINDIPLVISIKTKDSIITYIPKLLTGTFDVHLFYKGYKFTLPKKIVIKNEIFNFNFPKNLTFNLYISSIPVRQYSSWADYNGPNRTSGSSTYDKIFNSKHENLKLSESGIVSFNTLEYYLSKSMFSHTKVRIVFNDNFKKIQMFDYESIQRDFDTYHDYSGEFKLRLENLDYSIIHENNQQKFVIDIKGKDLDNAYFIITNNISIRNGNGNQRHTSDDYFLTIRDSTSGKKVNFFPATDSSSIRIELY